MNPSEEETSEAESPLIKSRSIFRKESSAESEAYDSEPESTSGSDESKEKADDTEKLIHPANPTASKPPSKLKDIASRSGVKPKKYDIMVLEAMQKLNENRRNGVSIRRIIKYVNENYEVTNMVNFFCKKAIDKGLKEDIYVHTSGKGMSGSIVFSAKHWKELKNEQKKILKTTKKKEASKPTAKAKLQAKPKPTATKKANPEGKDKNNNPTGKAAPKKPTAASKGKGPRLSVNIIPMIKASKKTAPGTATNTGKPSAKPTEKAGPSTKGKAKGATAVVTRKGKSENE